MITRPWPSMLRTLSGDDDRYQRQYWSGVPGAYFTGDGARQDEDGYFWIVGRIDDVLNVAGHRIGTAEVRARLSRIRRWLRRRLWAGPMISRGRRWLRLSR